MKIFSRLMASSVAAAGMLAVSAPAQAQSDPYLGQLMLFGGTFCPRGWSTASGQLLPISQYSALFSILGTTYGGDGRTSFGLPDLRGRAPISTGTGPGLSPRPQGSRGGSESFTLNTLQMPSHTHTGTIGVSRNANTNNPSNASLAKLPAGENGYSTEAPGANNLNSGSLRINNTGGGQSVAKVSPYLTLQWCVALQGIFPSRN